MVRRAGRLMGFQSGCDTHPTFPLKHLMRDATAIRPSNPPPTPSPSRIIRAYKRGWPRRAVLALMRYKLRTGMHRIYGQGFPRLRDEMAARPQPGVLMMANHSSWWDFFMAAFTFETLGLDGYGMTEHSNLRKFGFFRRIGAYSVDRTDPISVREAIDYTSELLGQPRTAVFFFPQGKIVCNDVRPLEFQGGLRLILQKVGRLRVVPTAFRYDFWQDERPEAFVRLGEVVEVDRAQRATVLDDLRDRLTAELDMLKVDTLTQDPSRFELLLQGGESVHDWWDRTRRRYLAGWNPG